MRENIKLWALQSLVSTNIVMPIIFIKGENYEKYLKRLELYKKIFAFFDMEDVFNRYARDIYEDLKMRKRVKEKSYMDARKALRWELRKVLVENIERLREEGLGREADKIQEQVDNNKLLHAFKLLREIRSVEKEIANVDALMNLYLKIFDDLKKIKNLGIETGDIEGRLIEISNIGGIKIPDKKMILVNDPTGNATCILSLLFKKRNIPHTVFSSTGIGDFWITKIEVEDKINPNMYTSDISERIMKGRGILILEDLNYLILNNKFGEIYRFLYYLRNHYGDRIIVTLNLNALNERERARLKGIADEIIDMEIPLNLCGIHLIFLPRRKSEGALLLSKDLGRNFKGSVFMIADFGGEKSLHPQRIEFEIFDKIADAFREGDIVIDAMDVLIDENSIEKIYLWLKSVRDLAKKSGRIVYVVVKDLIPEEREYLRPVADVDYFYLSSMESDKILIYQRELEKIEDVISRKVAKECAYNIETIRRLYQKYPAMLRDLEGEIRKVETICTKFDTECLLNSAPLIDEIKKRTEEVEELIKKFKIKEEEVRKRMEIISEYVDVGDIQRCLMIAGKILESGKINTALREIDECIKKSEEVYEEAVKNAERIYEELKCVEYLLPPYFKNKLAKISKIENLGDFAIMHSDVKNVLLKKIAKEIEKLKKYSSLSGIALGEIEAPLKNEDFCEYKKLRDSFLDKFKKEEEKINEKIGNRIVEGIEFLKENKYDAKKFEEDMKKAKETDELLKLEHKVSQLLTKVMKEKIRDFYGKHGYKLEELRDSLETLEKRIVEDPFESIDFYRDVIRAIKTKIGIAGELDKIEDEINEYYKILRSYNVEFEEKHPRDVKEGEEILKKLKENMERLNPVMDVDIVEWGVDEDRDMRIRFRVSNNGVSDAKNIIVDISGSTVTDFDIPVLKSGESAEVVIESHLDDLGGKILVDVSCEGLKGSFVYSSFEFELNVKGYTLQKATGKEKCSLCRGKIFRGDDMLVCSQCGAKYHQKCAMRSGKCVVCDNTFLFEK